MIGGIIGIGGTFLSSLTDNFWIFLGLFSGTFGITNGLTMAVAMNVAWSYFPGREGMVTGIISANFSLGGFIFGILSIQIVNPEGDNQPFDYVKVTSKVPWML